MQYTKVFYMYRDASNYKFWGEFVVAGTFTLPMVEDYLFDGEFFVPHEVGIEHLLDMPMNEDDHYLHTIEGVESCNEKEVVCTVKELIERFKSASEKGWFFSFKPDW